jgi:hypothetical protein
MATPKMCTLAKPKTFPTWMGNNFRQLFCELRGRDNPLNRPGVNSANSIDNYQLTHGAQFVATVNGRDTFTLDMAQYPHHTSEFWNNGSVEHAQKSTYTDNKNVLVVIMVNSATNFDANRSLTRKAIYGNPYFIMSPGKCLREWSPAFGAQENEPYRKTLAKFAAARTENPPTRNAMGTRYEVSDYKGSSDGKHIITILTGAGQTHTVGGSNSPINQGEWPLGQTAMNYSPGKPILDVDSHPANGPFAGVRHFCARLMASQSSGDDPIFLQFNLDLDKLTPGVTYYFSHHVSDAFKVITGNSAETTPSLLTIGLRVVQVLPQQAWGGYKTGTKK